MMATALEWILVGLLVAGSAAYSVWRLLPRRRHSGEGCKTCPAHSSEDAKPSPTQKTGALPR